MFVCLDKAVRNVVDSYNPSNVRLFIKRHTYKQKENEDYRMLFFKIKSMDILDLLTIVLFSVGILLVGLSFTRKGKNMKSFFAAGGAVPWSISGLSLFMGFFSAGTFVVWGAIAYSLGWVSVTIQWTMAIAGLVVGFFIAPRWHRTGTLTAAEYIQKRLGSKTQKAYTYIFLFISIFTTGSFLYPVGKILEVSTGLPLNTSIILLGIFCILYVSAGGLWAVVSTDVIQFIILTAAVLIVVPLSFDKIGGVQHFINSASDGFFQLFNGEYTLPFIVAFGVYNAIFIGGNWAYVQRYTSVKTKSDSQRVGWLFGCLYVVSPVLWMLPPMVYKILNPSLPNLESEGAYLLICKEVLPSGLLGMMLAGMIFATASSLNANLNISSGVVTNDIFKRLKPDSSDKTLMRVARISTIVFGLLAIGIALLVPLMGGIVNVVISIAALTGVPLYLPIIWSLFSKRQTGKTILTTTLLSLVVNGFFKFVSPVMFDFALDRAGEMILGVIFPALCLAVFEVYFKITNRVSDRYINYQVMEQDVAFRKQHLTPEEDLAQKNENDFSRKVIGTAILFVGIAIAILSLIAKSRLEIVLPIAVLIFTIGVFLRIKKKKF